MSSKNSPNLTPEEGRQILTEEDTGNLCLCVNDTPYGVPVSYAFIDGKIVFHSALEGEKLRIMRANPNVCFIVSRHLDRMKPHHVENGCSYRFESVLCFGKARIIDDIEERFEYLKKFKSYFYKRLGLDDSLDEVTKNAAEKCTCVVIDIENMTGRRKS